ncbi:MAG: LysR substrate-binding domain-containing protein [Candidatus Heteroscillospira sp.]
MNLKQLSYIVKIAECQNISKAADELYISRSALNGYLLQLEEELKTPLFHRIQKKLVLTNAGEKYVEAAKSILDIREQLYKELGDISDNSCGRINLGVNRSIGEKIFRETFSAFHQKYPRYNVKLTASENIEAELIGGKIDWAIMGYGTAKQLPTELVQIPLGTCEIVLALPSSHPLAKYAAPPGAPYSTIDLNLLRDDKFILLNPGVNARMVADERFLQAGFKPNILMECNGGMVASQLVKDGLGPSILVETLVSQDKRVCCFSLKPKAFWTHSVSYRKGTVFSKAELYYLELIKLYLKDKI